MSLGPRVAQARKLDTNYFLSSDQNQTFLVFWVQVPIEQPLFSYWLEHSVMGGLNSPFLRFSHGTRKQDLTPLKNTFCRTGLLQYFPCIIGRVLLPYSKYFYDVSENKVLFQNANSSVSLFCFEVNIADDVRAFSRSKLLANV